MSVAAIRGGKGYPPRGMDGEVAKTAPLAFDDLHHYLSASPVASVERRLGTKLGHC